MESIVTKNRQLSWDGWTVVETFPSEKAYYSKFGIYKNYQKIKENDYVAITNAGAYGASLSSNYNTRPLVAEILVNKNKLRYIRKKQNLLKLINS